MSSPDEVELARRVLKVIREHGHPSHADALALRLWAEPHSRMDPLEDIAKEVLQAENVSTNGSQTNS